MRGVAAQMVQAKVNGWIVRAGWAGFWGGGRAQVPSLPAADPLTSDGNGVYFTYTLYFNLNIASSALEHVTIHNVRKPY